MKNKWPVKMYVADPDKTFSAIHIDNKEYPKTVDKEKKTDIIMKLYKSTITTAGLTLDRCFVWQLQCLLLA